MSARVSLRLEDGSTTELPLSTMTSEAVLSGVPWRTIRSHRGQRHFPGLYWSSTTGGHVVYESRLELARLLLADADSEIVGIAAQPFLVSDKQRRHVPDFLLARVDGSVLIVNVKPAHRLDDPQVAAALAWAGRIFAARGWQHEIWSGADPYLLANLRLLAGYRRSAHLDQAAIEAVSSLDLAGLTVAGAEAVLAAAGIADPRPVLLHLVWAGALRVDLTCPLTCNTKLEVHS